jgi:REP element-mobilizing transposase RayT
MEEWRNIGTVPMRTAPVGTRYFCATVGAVDEEMIKAYIENQK